MKPGGPNIGRVRGVSPAVGVRPGVDLTGIRLELGQAQHDPTEREVPAQQVGRDLDGRAREELARQAGVVGLTGDTLTAGSDARRRPRAGVGEPVAGSGELLGDADRGGAAGGVARRERPLDGQHRAHLGGQVLADAGRSPRR